MMGVPINGMALVDNEVVVDVVDVVVEGAGRRLWCGPRSPNSDPVPP